MSATHGVTSTNTSLTNNQIYKGDLIMADHSIHNFEHFLKELEKNVLTINTLLQQVTIVVKNSYGPCRAMHGVCRDWRKDLDKS